MSWAKDEWKVDLPQNVLGEISDLESRVELLLEDKKSLQFRVDSMQVLIDNKKQTELHLQSQINELQANEQKIINDLLSKSQAVEKLESTNKALEHASSLLESQLEAANQKLSKSLSDKLKVEQDLLSKLEVTERNVDELSTENRQLKEQEMCLLQQTEVFKNQRENLACAEKLALSTTAENRRLQEKISLLTNEFREAKTELKTEKEKSISVVENRKQTLRECSPPATTPDKKERQDIKENETDSGGHQSKSWNLDIFHFRKRVSELENKNADLLRCLENNKRNVRSLTQSYEDKMSPKTVALRNMNLNSSPSLVPSRCHSDPTLYPNPSPLPEEAKQKIETASCLEECRKRQKDLQAEISRLNGLLLDKEKCCSQEHLYACLQDSNEKATRRQDRVHSESHSGPPENTGGKDSKREAESSGNDCEFIVNQKAAPDLHASDTMCEADEKESGGSTQQGNVASSFCDCQAACSNNSSSKDKGEYVVRNTTESATDALPIASQDCKQSQTDFVGCETGTECHLVVQPSDHKSCEVNLPAKNNIDTLAIVQSCISKLSRLVSVLGNHKLATLDNSKCPKDSAAELTEELLCGSLKKLQDLIDAASSLASDSAAICGDGSSPQPRKYSCSQSRRISELASNWERKETSKSAVMELARERTDTDCNRTTESSPLSPNARSSREADFKHGVKCRLLWQQLCESKSIINSYEKELHRLRSKRSEEKELFDTKSVEAEQAQMAMTEMKKLVSSEYLCQEKTITDLETQVVAKSEEVKESRKTIHCLRSDIEILQSEKQNYHDGIKASFERMELRQIKFENSVDCLLPVLKNELHQLGNGISTTLEEALKVFTSVKENEFASAEHSADGLKAAVNLEHVTLRSPRNRGRRRNRSPIKCDVRDDLAAGKDLDEIQCRAERARNGIDVLYTKISQLEIERDRLQETSELHHADLAVRDATVGELEMKLGVARQKIEEHDSAYQSELESLKVEQLDVYKEFKELCNTLKVKEVELINRNKTIKELKSSYEHEKTSKAKQEAEWNKIAAEREKELASCSNMLHSREKDVAELVSRLKRSEQCFLDMHSRLASIDQLFIECKRKCLY